MKGRRGEYGFDAPYVPALLALGSLPLLFGAGQRTLHGDLAGALSMGLSGLFLLLSAGSYVYATRVGKFAAWEALLEAQGLRGDERVLDVGCGRGAVLLLVAKRLSSGKAVGVDLWQQRDQSGNGLEAARANAAAEAVAEKVELRTADMRELPLEDESFDLVVSSLAVHNVPDAEGRAKAVRECARVLRRGGTLLLADFRFTAAYAAVLREAGLRDVQVRSLGAGFWYGGPWAATHVVSAKKG